MLTVGRKYKHRNCLDMVIEIVDAARGAWYVVRYWHKRGWLLHEGKDFINYRAIRDKDWREV